MRWPRERFCCLPFSEPDGVVYKYDDTNPDARTARLLADRAIQAAAGRQRCGACRKRAGARDRRALHRLCCAGPAGDEPDGLGDVGTGLLDCGGAAEEAAEADGGFADAALAVPGVVSAFAAGDAGDRGGGLSGLCARWCLGCRFADRCGAGIAVRAHFAGVFRAGAADCVAGEDHGGRSGLMNLVMLPMWILSGVFFSASRFPAVIQPFVRALPLTAAIEAMRGNMLQGCGTEMHLGAGGDLAGVAGGAVCGVAADLPVEIAGAANLER